MLLALPITALVVLVAFQFYRAEEGRLRQAERAAGRDAIASATATAAGRIDQVARDLNFLARDLALEGALADAAPPPPELLQRWAAFSSAKGSYDQIRWIDAGGRERLRIERHQGHVVVEPESALADKQARYYFTEAMRLAPGKLYVSPMDLNVEQGRVEQPPKPVLRVATPVVAADGAARGIVVLNYLGRQLLDALREAGGPYLWMTNTEGQWLIGPSPQDEFGFMFERPTLGLASAHPESWARMLDASDGQFQDAEATWTFRKVPALVDVQDRIDGSAGEGVSWMLVHRRPLALIDAALTQALGRNALVALAVLLVVLFGAWRLTRSQAELASAARRASDANRAKTDFLANMSHEIRTPLNAVIGLSRLLERDTRDPRLRGYVGKIRSASRSLLGIVNDVLDITRIEAGELALDEAAFRIDLLLRDIDGLMAIEAHAKGLMLTVHPLPAGVPLTLVGDALRVRQILLNLLHNAIKFTDEGHIEVQVSQQPDPDPQRVRLRLAVHDTGVGIEPEQHAQVFARFSQVDSSNTRRFGGSGLGLAIVRQLAEMMGGTAGLSSVSGHGSTFWVTLGLRVAGHGAGAPVSGAGWQLVAALSDLDEGPALLAPARALGWSVQVVADEPHLLAAVTDAVGGDRPVDVVLVDGALLGPDRLRSMAAGDGAIDGVAPPVVLGIGDQSQPGSDAAVQGWIALPITPCSLFNAVAQAVFRARGSDAAERLMELTSTDDPGLQWLPDVRVLLVDDNQINLEITGQVLQRDGAQVTACSDGFDALERLCAAPQAFDLVLMDVQMPGIDGFETTRRIRREPALRDLPVVALTAGALATQRLRAGDSGMDGFLVNPIDTPELVRTVRQQVERRCGKPWPVRTRDDPQAGRDLPEALWPAIDGIDAYAIEARLAGDSTAFLRLLDQFCQRAADLTSAAPGVPSDAADRQLLARRLHRVRGGARLLGATEVARSAGEAEQALAENSTELAESALAALTTALQTLQEQAEPWMARQRTARQRDREDAQALAPAPVSTQVDELIEMLRRHELAALDLYRGMAASLQQRLGAQDMQVLDNLLDQLEFDQAAALLNNAFDRG